MEENSQITYIKIDFDDGIEAETLSTYIKAIGKELKYYLKEKHLENQYSEKLYIKEIKSGCIEIFPYIQLLVGATIPFLPQYESAPILYDYMKTIINNLVSFKIPDNLQINNNRLNLYSDINLLSQTTKSITYNYIYNGKHNYIEQPHGNEAILIENNINDKLTEKDNLIVGEIYKSVPFYWDTAKFLLSEKSNFKGKVDSIIKKSFITIWENDEDKKYMTEESHLEKPWQELNYVVDLKIEELRDTYCYKILKVHKEQTFYIE